MAENTNKSKWCLKEEEILSFWKDNKIFEKSLEKKSPEGEFVFYEGPPTANGKPGIHHLEARAFKDVIPRYKTMKGFHVRRKAGWDTHGLPVEIAVEKELGLKSKKEIENFGVAPFNKKCKESVLRYIEEWDRFTDRIGYWVDKENAYFTFQNSYIESLWNIVKKVDDQNLLYKDYKVVPWCARCGTALSSHELAQGYQDVKDLSVYVKFKVVGQENTYLLAWTTTPWTLPGNVALAVGEEIDYVKIEIAGEKNILAKSRLEIVPGEYKILEEMKGKDLLGLEYEPLFLFLKDNLPESEKEKLSKAFKVYGADFVTTVDGTGIVHTAVMYGQDDFVLGTKIGLPKMHLVKEDGTFIPEAGFLSGRFVKEENADGKPTLAVDIIDDLKKRNLFFKQENYKHSYPFCWRCKTPLIYYARDSWYIRMSELREKLIEENQKINWEPAYIKDGRFGEWLKDLKDWAISRERYWGTPLPVWVSVDGKEKVVVDSLDTLKKYSKKSGNKYFMMRHGEAEHNVKGVFSSDEEAIHHLTEKGRNDARENAKKLKGLNIDLILYSPLTRTKETSEEVLSVLGKDVEVKEEKRLREEGFGGISGMKVSDWGKYFKSFKDRMDVSVSGCETLREIKRRMGEFIYEIENKYSGKNILFITHAGPAKLLDAVSLGLNDSELEKFYLQETMLPYASFKELNFVPIPHNEDYVLDLHKPYIDEVRLVGSGGGELKRVKEVMDVWFDSGAMPFAQDHYPFENKKYVDSVGFPADYISEAIDQTRGWFYTLHAVGVLVGKGRAYKNVICLGHLNDKDGKKMSKSLGNVIDPWTMIEKYGADALRIWMYSVNQPGETKNFDEKTVDEIVKKYWNLLSNVFSFYELYRDKTLEEKDQPKSKNILDVWILENLSQLASFVTKHMDQYKVLEPMREIRSFIDDLSTWYLRRSRDRFKDGDVEAKKTLYFVLKTLAKILAPFTPFYAEDLYQNLRTESDLLSVHLENYPEFKEGFLWFKNEPKTLKDMQEVRKIASLALDARQKANIKVRQPLGQLKVKNGMLKEEFLEIIKDEVNVKEIIFDEEVKGEILLDTNITAELKEEGTAREFMRNLQDLRKEKGFEAKDRAELSIISSPEFKNLVEKFAEEIKKTVGLSKISFDSDAEKVIALENFEVKVGIKKV